MQLDFPSHILNMLNITSEDLSVPHCTLEFSANLDASVDFPALCRDISDAILATGLFEKGAVRVRALRCEAYAIADNLPRNAFIDMSFRIGVGRSAAEKRQAGEAILGAAKRRLCLAALLAFAVTYRQV